MVFKRKPASIIDHTDKRQLKTDALLLAIIFYKTHKRYDFLIKIWSFRDATYERYATNEVLIYY